MGQFKNFGIFCIYLHISIGGWETWASGIERLIKHSYKQQPYCCTVLHIERTNGEWQRWVFYSESQSYSVYHPVSLLDWFCHPLKGEKHKTVLFWLILTRSDQKCEQRKLNKHHLDLSPQTDVCSEEVKWVRTFRPMLGEGFSLFLHHLEINRMYSMEIYMQYGNALYVLKPQSKFRSVGISCAVFKLKCRMFQCN